MSEVIKLNRLIIDPRYQMRVAMDQQTVSLYAEAMAIGDKFPALVAYCFDAKPEDGAVSADNTLYLLDGNHRYKAYLQQGIEEVECEIRWGTPGEARKFAVECNQKNGLQMTYKDRRNAYELLFDEFEKKNVSNGQIAKFLKVTPTTISNWKGDLMAKRGLMAAARMVVGGDGKTYKVEPAPEKHQWQTGIPKASREEQAKYVKMPSTRPSHQGGQSPVEETPARDNTPPANPSAPDTTSPPSPLSDYREGGQEAPPLGQVSKLDTSEDNEPGGHVAKKHSPARWGRATVKQAHDRLQHLDAATAAAMVAAAQESATLEELQKVAKELVVVATMIAYMAHPGAGDRVNLVTGLHAEAREKVAEWERKSKKGGV
jgi:ParB-like chromosome segregation protein Spo0J